MKYTHAFDLKMFNFGVNFKTFEIALLFIKTKGPAIFARWTCGLVDRSYSLCDTEI